MSNMNFLENVLLIALSMLIPIGAALFVSRIPFLSDFLRRHVIARVLTIALAGVVAFLVWLFLVPLKIENIDLIFSNIDSNVWDYSALPAQASNCQFDAVTCAYIKPTPPFGSYDPDTLGSSPWMLLASPILAAIIGGIMIWRGTDKASSMSLLPERVSAQM
jgi:hypothetical protein